MRLFSTILPLLSACTATLVGDWELSAFDEDEYGIIF